MFGRGGEESIQLVRAGVPIRVTPGITAGVGGLAYAGIPVTHRDTNQSVTFLTGHDQTGATPAAIDWQAVARGSQVIVLYMSMKHLDRIACELIKGGRPGDEPVAVVCNATLPSQRVLISSLACLAGDVRANAMVAPAIICIGKNVPLRNEIDWAEEWLEGQLAMSGFSEFATAAGSRGSGSGPA